ncbi:AraC family transcriptional regulator [Cupriavidus gilardii]|uniref:AraC family transcriptional regulator n=1 Tax=Cupriavidus gilardii TaxID=82541 RepID=UPI001ABE2F2F|nr:AraC family transcriptional regulator [Cupriavidus gilardii]MBO4120450.1 AraC family transcriptional regulator [Cupriavidus gilardii]
MQPPSDVPADVSAPALGAVHRFHASELPHVEALCTRLFGPTRVRPLDAEAPLHVEIEQCHIGQLSLVDIRYSTAMEIEPQPGKDEYVIQTTLSGHCEALTEGQSQHFPQGSTLVASPTQRTRLLLDAACERFCVVLRRRAIEHAFREHFGFEPPAPIAFATRLAGGSGLDEVNRLAERWHALVGYLRAEMRTRRAGSANPTIDASIEHMVVSTLLFDQFSGDGATLPRRFQPTLPAYVRRAIQYLRRNLDRPITMRELADHCGVSERSLQVGFRRSKNATPMEYLRLLRLQGARDSLLRAPPQPGAVTAIALRHGFSHLSMFSREYRREFGELPSETLRRAQRREG